MPVTVKKRDGKYRIVEPSGKIAQSKNGNPMDGGGHKDRSKAIRQQNAINMRGKNIKVE